MTLYLRFGRTSLTTSWRNLLCVVLVLLCSSTSLQAAEKQKLFNGKDLKGWAGDEKVWSVEDGQIVGSSVKHKIATNTFLVWQGGEVQDFRLVFKARLEGNNNSGVQYRSKRSSPKDWQVAGYQADIHPQPEYTGMLYGEGLGRGIIAERGQQVVIGKEAVVTTLKGYSKPIAKVDLTKWHEFTILARGNRLIHKLDGKVTVDVTDNHEKKCERGILALQVHAGEPMTVYFKDIVLEDLTLVLKK